MASLDPSAGASKPHRMRRNALLAGLGVVLAVCTWAFVPFPESQPMAAPMAAIAVLMAVWWVLEVVPIPVTALLPLVLMPLFGVAELGDVSAKYGKGTIFLFLGGFILALGLQRSALHRRIALGIISRIGSRPNRLLLGFMLATALLSMWISNTASVMVMMPIGLSVLEESRQRGVPGQVVGFMGTAIMLGIAYAADIGGMATPVGTPPNLVLLEMQTELFPDAPIIGFGQWALMGIPLATLFLGSGWLLLSRVIFRLPREPLFAQSGAIEKAVSELGPIRRDEVLCGLVFGVTALLWMTGSDIQLGETYYIPGWRGFLGLEAVGDPVVAVGAAIVLFLIPSKDRPGEALMDWETAKTLPWGILLLFGGGFGLAMGFETSGLSVVIGDGVAGLRGVNPVLVVIIVCAALTFLTELTSNTATTTLVLPILANASVALGIDPRALMIPATLSASCAFMMPVASPTQAIVFGSGYVPIKQMVRAGIWFNILGIVIVTLVFLVLGGPVFGVDLTVLPAWATP